MGTIPEINNESVIKSKLDELQNCYNLVNMLLGFVTGLKTKLTLDLSPACSELGKHAGFIADCRDKIINQKTIGLVKLLNDIRTMQELIDPSKTQLNKQFNQVMDGSFEPITNSPDNQ